MVDKILPGLLALSAGLSVSGDVSLLYSALGLRPAATVHCIVVQQDITPKKKLFSIEGLKGSG